MQLEVVAMGIAKAIAKTGKYQSNEQKEAFAYILTNSEKEHLNDNLGRIGNVSQTYQELVKGGVIKGSGGDSALCREVTKALDIIGKLEAKRLEDLMNNA